MKKVKAMNGYTIYQSTSERDHENYSCNVGNFNIYFSSDIRDYGLKMSYAEFEDIESLEICEQLCNNNYAVAREIAEEESTCISFERVEEIEKQLDAGKTADEIVEAAEDVDELEETENFASIINVSEFRFEKHIFNWTLINIHTVNNITYGLAESSIGDEAPYILFKLDYDKIYIKDFWNKKLHDTIKMYVFPSECIIDDEVYDDIIIALEDNMIL